MAEQTKSESEKPSTPVSSPPAAAAANGPKVQVGMVFLGIVAMMVFQECSSGIKTEKQKDPKVGTFDALSNYFLGPEEPAPDPVLRENEVLIQFCMSCASKGYYQQVAQLMQTRTSSPLKVIPSEFPLSRRVQMLQQMVSMATMGLMVCLFVMDSVLPEAMRNNKMGAFLMIWIGSSMVSSAFSKSNAFEIYHGSNGLIWSSMKEERLPNMNDLVNALKSVDIDLIPPRAG